MNQHQIRRADPWSAAALAVMMAAGCVQLDPGTGTGGGGAGGTGGVLEGTDAQVCGAGCDTIIGCGIELDQTGCKESCIASAGLVACFRQVTATCNDLSACVLNALCSGSIPSGSSACEAGQSCLISCAGNADPGCGCACMPQVTSAQTAAVYAIAVCASVHCSFECAPNGGDPGSCQSCLASECETADLQCQ